MSRRALLAVLLGAVLTGSVLTGCRLERRADLDADDEGPAATAGGQLGSPAADSAVSVVETAEAVLEGRESRPLDALLHPDAVVFPQPGSGDVPDEWQLLESRVELRDDLALVFRRHRSLEEGQPGESVLAGSWVLLREGERWLVFHIHRSRGTLGR